MQLQIRKTDNQICGYSLSGGLQEDDNFYVEEVDEMPNDEEIYWSKYEDKKINFYQELKDKFLNEEHIADLRHRRQVECFEIINRGSAWYSLVCNTEERLNELKEWYQAWLDVTDTLEVPEKPEWIN